MASKIFPGNNHELCELKNLKLGIGCSCGEVFATCKDSRQSPKGFRWRRKKCAKCGKTYTTVEINAEYINDLDDIAARYAQLVNSIEAIKKISDAPYEGMRIISGSSGQ